MIRGRPRILTPALEGSRAVIPATPFPGFRGGRGYFDPGPPGPMLPPLGGPAMIMPAERISVPSLMQRRPPSARYLGPPSLIPSWGGYSYGGNYFPERRPLAPAPPILPPPPQMIKSEHDRYRRFWNSTQWDRYLGPGGRPPPLEYFQYREGQKQSHYRQYPSNSQWDSVLGPQGKPPPVDYFRYREGQEPRKGVRKRLKHPFPGPKALRRFRHLGFAAWFIAILKANARKQLSTRPSSMFLFGIILKEIVAALHRIYLNPSGNIYPVLNDIIGPNAYDLASLVRGGRMGVREEAVLIQEMQYVIENIIYHITEIMPSTGVLGTHRKSACFELIRSGKRFPDGYFWQVELERLRFNEHGRTVNVGDAEGFMLFLGLFISRSLVTTILMKPVDYGLSSQPLTDVAERNLRIVATTLLYLVRRIAVSRGRGVMGMPGEIAKYLYNDEEMTNIYSKLSRTFNYCEGLLREWGTEYIRRLRASSMNC